MGYSHVGVELGDQLDDIFPGTYGLAAVIERLESSNPFNNTDKEKHET